jgi:[ribosomal protein S5]-alanine N-acetyltransferase
VIHALAGGQHALAARLAEEPLTGYLLGSECIGLWRMRSQQITDDPQSAVWITRLIVALSPVVGRVVGLAGFHGPPDAIGMVEIGYRVDPTHRRHGYARAALEVLLEQAVRDLSVRIIRATISPDNTASRTLIDQYGFVEVGEQCDDEDGLEIIFERPATPAST